LAYLIGDKGKNNMNSILGGSKILETFCVVVGHSRKAHQPKKKERKKDEVVKFGCNPKCIGGAP
jgi:hypothetical protein